MRFLGETGWPSGLTLERNILQLTLIHQNKRDKMYYMNIFNDTKPVIRNASVVPRHIFLNFGENLS